MQVARSTRIFQRVPPLGFVSSSPIPRLCDSAVSLNALRKALQPPKTELSEYGESLLSQISPHPQMYKPGEDNPLGNFSPYIPAMTIPGIKRAPRPMEEPPIPGSDRLLKIRRPSADGPYAAYRGSVGRWHSLVDEHISSCLTSVYCLMFLAFIFAPHNLTFKEVITFLDA